MKSSSRTRSIRFQLLLAVNGPIATLVTVFLVYDYQREFASHLDEKRVALKEEAKTLLPAIEAIRHHGLDDVQDYIDKVCGQMQDKESPGHHIAARVGESTLQAVSHHRASPEMLDAMQAATEATDGRASAGTSEFVVGSFGGHGSTVYVAENLEHVRQSLRSAFLRRLTGFLALAAMAAFFVNIVLGHIVTRPIGRLVTTVQKIAKGDLGAQTDVYGSSELNYLAGEINVMIAALDAADRDRKAQMEKAREIQQNLLPAEVEIPGLTVATLFEPAEEVGGDYFDILPLGDGSWIICIADVTGHGTPAAMSAAMLKTLLLQATEQHRSPADILAFISRRFSSLNLPGDFLSMFVLRAAPNNRYLEYASAGHEPALLLTTSGEIRELPATGMLLGISDDEAWDNVSLEVKAHERVIITTDGVTEAFNQEDECFGRKRLANTFIETRNLSLANGIRHVEETLVAFRDGAPQFDDVTAVLIEVDSP